MAIFDGVRITVHRIQVKDLYNEYNLIKVMFSLIGLALLIMESVMPKPKRRSIIGLGAKWSLSSEDAWRKGQFCVSISS